MRESKLRGQEERREALAALGQNADATVNARLNLVACNQASRREYPDGSSSYKVPRIPYRVAQRFQMSRSRLPTTSCNRYLCFLRCLCCSGCRQLFQFLLSLFLSLCKVADIKVMTRLLNGSNSSAVNTDARSEER